MSVEIKLGREYYHRIREIEKWCETNVGLGDWAALSDFREDKNLQWSINQQFGYTFVRFRQERDATLFTLRWL
jgi:hypothetical protein